MREGDLHPPDAAPPESLGPTWPPPRLEWTDLDAAFVAAIRDEPDDDVPRRIYADWLLDQGDPRGLFVHLDIDCLSERDPLRLRMLLRDRKRLLQRYEEWWSPADKVVAIGGFSRGFLDAVTMTPEQVLAHGDAVFAREPIYELRFSLPEGGPPSIADCPCLRHVTRLRVEHHHAGLWLRDLLWSEHLAGLRALTLFNRPLGSLSVRDLNTLTGSPVFGRLRTLRVAGSSPYDLASLLGCDFRVERLEVPGWCEPAPIDLLDDDAPRFIHHESIGREGLELLARHPAARSLRYLDASYNPVELVLPDILASPHLTGLETIRTAERQEIDLTRLRARS